MRLNTRAQIFSPLSSTSQLISNLHSPNILTPLFYISTYLISPLYQYPHPSHLHINLSQISTLPISFPLSSTSQLISYPHSTNILTPLLYISTYLISPLSQYPSPSPLHLNLSQISTLPISFPLYSTSQLISNLHSPNILTPLLYISTYLISPLSQYPQPSPLHLNLSRISTLPKSSPLSSTISTYLISPLSQYPHPSPLHLNLSRISTLPISSTLSSTSQLISHLHSPNILNPLLYISTYLVSPLSQNPHPSPLHLNLSRISTLPISSPLSSTSQRISDLYSPNILPPLLYISTYLRSLLSQYPHPSTLQPQLISYLHSTNILTPLLYISTYLISLLSQYPDPSTLHLNLSHLSTLPISFPLSSTSQLISFVHSPNILPPLLYISTLSQISTLPISSSLSSTPQLISYLHSPNILTPLLYISTYLTSPLSQYPHPSPLHLNLSHISNSTNILTPLLYISTHLTSPLSQYPHPSPLHLNLSHISTLPISSPLSSTSQLISYLHSPNILTPLLYISTYLISPLSQYPHPSPLHLNLSHISTLPIS